MVEQEEKVLLLISRYLEGVAEQDEIFQLNNWIRTSGTNMQYFEQLRNIWDASGKQTGHNNISAPEALKNVKSRIAKHERNRPWNRWQKIAVAAVILLALGSFPLFHIFSHKIDVSGNPVYVEVYAAFGTRSALKLSDSTQVWLNSGSSLRYPDKFDKNNRKVFLKGEAYFEVNCDYSRPFVVQTSTLMIKATGTKFNVQDYDLSSITEVTLISGKVFVDEPDNKDGLRQISELNPSQHLIFNKQNKTRSILNEEAYKYIAWKDGKLIFRNEPLCEVVKKIGQLFNITIELQGEELQDYRYRATFEDESLEEMLKLLKMSSPIDYIEVKRTPLPDGSFPKKKVIIFPAKITRIDNNFKK